MESKRQHSIKVDTLNVALAVFMAKHHQLISSILHRSCHTHSIHCFLVKMRLTQQIIKSETFSVNDLEMVVDDAQEESTTEGSFIRERLSELDSWYNNWDFGD
jgi:hypothetical protein